MSRGGGGGGGFTPNYEFQQAINKPVVTKVVKDQSLPQRQNEKEDFDSDEIKRSNMQQMMNYLTKSHQNDDNEEDNEVNDHMNAIGIDEETTETYNKFPIPPLSNSQHSIITIAPTTTTLITASEDQPEKISLQTDLRLSSSPLSDSTTSPSSSISITPSNELIINEENYPPSKVTIESRFNENSYDNRIYISTSNINSEIHGGSLPTPHTIRDSSSFESNKASSLPVNRTENIVEKEKTFSAESLIIDDETGEKFSKNKKSTETQLNRINSDIKNLVLNTNEDDSIIITQVVKKPLASNLNQHQNADGDCFYCKLNRNTSLKQNSRLNEEPAAIESPIKEHVHSDKSEDCVYCKLKGQKEAVNNKAKRPQSTSSTSNAVFYDDTNVFENRKSSPPAVYSTFTNEEAKVAEELNRKSISSDDENLKSSAKRRSTELNGIIPSSPNKVNDKELKTPPIVTPRTSTQPKASSLPTHPRPVSVNTFTDSANTGSSSSLQRSKSLAGSMFKSNDLNLKTARPLVRQSVQLNNGQQENRKNSTESTRKHSNNSSKENIDDACENEVTTLPQMPTNTTTENNENVILNKRKCSVNLDELKRRRSEDEQIISQKVDSIEPKPTARKNSYMSKSLQDNSLTQRNNNSNNILIQQNSNQVNEENGVSINVKSKIKLMELKTNLPQTSLSSLNSPTTPTSITQSFVVPPIDQQQSLAPQQIIRSDTFNVEFIDNNNKFNTLTLTNKPKQPQKQQQIPNKNTEINENSITKLIKLKPTFVSSNFNNNNNNELTTVTTSLPVTSTTSYKNPLANNVFIVESSKSTSTIVKPTSDENNDEYENNNNNIISSRRQTVKQLKSKFENK